MSSAFGEERPWGKYEVLLEEDTYKVKRIIVKPGQRLSLQYHEHRSEVWVVVDGKAIITCGKDEIPVEKGQFVSIPEGTRHRIENPEKRDLVFVEVQNGNYLGEDDIVRLEDDYKRNT
jgi:mannose-6-phosphate isomerase